MIRITRHPLFRVEPERDREWVVAVQMKIDGEYGKAARRIGTSTTALRMFLNGVGTLNRLQMESLLEMVPWPGAASEVLGKGACEESVG